MAPGIADKKNNNLPMWGNEKTMNLNNLILTNILSSHYFKVNLYQLKTYHEVIDEIYYQVTHLEPWEKGSRKTSGQTGMCGGVRGVGAGGIVSTAFCILYKLFTLKLTRKQVVGLINHNDSPYIRALGFMYIRYTQPPQDLWPWYESYLEDDEEVDVKAGSGQTMTIGEMLRHFLSKLEWFSTLFPRIPVPIQKDLEMKLTEWRARTNSTVPDVCNYTPVTEECQESAIELENHESEKARRSRSESKDRDIQNRESNKEKDRQRHDKDRNSSRHHRDSSERSKNHSRHRSRSPHNRRSHKDDTKKSRSKNRDKDRSERSRHDRHSSHPKESRDRNRLSKDRKRDVSRGRESHSHSRSRNRH